jgi:hypothetical protein
MDEDELAFVKAEAFLVALGELVDRLIDQLESTQDEALLSLSTGWFRAVDELGFTEARLVLHQYVREVTLHNAALEDRLMRRPGLPLQ